jgi:hypothetical protein
MEKLDLRLVQLVYTSGDVAAIRTTSPVYSDAVAQQVAGLNDSVWREVRWFGTSWGCSECTEPHHCPRIELRVQYNMFLGRYSRLKVSGRVMLCNRAGVFASAQVLQHLALPGALLALAVMLSIPETRINKANTTSGTTSDKAGDGSKATDSSAATVMSFGAASSLGVPQRAYQPPQGSTAAVDAGAVAAPSATTNSGGWAGLGSLLRNRALMTTTAAAALNDVASYALIAWQSTLYERVYHLEVTQYAPVLAAILPLSGIVGGEQHAQRGF